MSSDGDQEGEEGEELYPAECPNCGESYIRRQAIGEDGRDVPDFEGERYQYIHREEDVDWADGAVRIHEYCTVPAMDTSGPLATGQFTVHQDLEDDHAQ